MKIIFQLRNLCGTNTWLSHITQNPYRTCPRCSTRFGRLWRFHYYCRQGDYISTVSVCLLTWLLKNYWSILCEILWNGWT